MLATSNVPEKQLKVIEQFKISVQSNMSSWKQMGFLNKAEYEQYRAERNFSSVNDSNFNSMMSSYQTIEPHLRTAAH